MTGRKKRAYALKHRLKVDVLDPAGGSAKASYWVLTNLNADVYQRERLRNVLGIYPEQFARDNAEIADSVTVNSITELCRMGIIGELSCTIKATNPAVYFPLIGVEQKTSFIYDLDKSVKDVARDLLSVEISVGPSSVGYKVVPGTVKIKKQKSRTPHLG